MLLSVSLISGLAHHQSLRAGDKGNFPENASAYPFLGSVYFSDDEIALLLASEFSSGLELCHLSLYDNSRVTTMDIQSEGMTLFLVPVQQFRLYCLAETKIL